MTDYLKAFIVGSSLPAFALFFIGFYGNKKYISAQNCVTKMLGIEPYIFYTIGAPLYMGVMSMLAVLIGRQYRIPTRQAFFAVSLLSPIIVSFLITYCDIYNFSPYRLKEQYLRLFVYHSMLYNLVIFPIFERL
jgi:hypothetical protein